jgi:hypothetical protein
MSGMNELIRMLQGYLSGAAGLGEFAEWLAGVDWDDAAMTEEQREGLGTFELLLTEVAEGLRGEREFFEEASRFVAKKCQTTFARQTFPESSVAIGTADTASWPQVMVAAAGQESLSWSISAQMVPV